MDLNEYEQRIGKSRHIEVKIKCEQCGIEKWAKWSRVKVGQGRFCSIACQGKMRNSNKQYVGKKNGKVTFDKVKNAYYVYWIDEESKFRKTTSYAHWWWEINKGKIPESYRASYKDGNSLNIDPENIILISSEEFGEAISKRLMKHSVDNETRKKISIAHTGTDQWNGFVNDFRYPGFSKQLKKKIKERDGYRCKVCEIDLQGSSRSRIHHIDGDKTNPNPDNLVLVCVDCHSLIHSKKVVNEQILAFRSALKTVL